MSSGLETRLLDLLSNPAVAAEQADLAQAAALRRQEIALRQRAGAAASRLRRTREAGAPAEETAALEALLKSRVARLDRTSRQAEAADMLRPRPDPKSAQIFGRTSGTVEKPPITAAVLSPEGKVLAAAAGMPNGSFHLVAEGDLDRVALQFSDATGRVLYRAAEPVTVEAGSVLLVEVALGTPKPEPGPVPTRLVTPDLVGQSEGVARALLDRLGLKAAIEDKTEAGEPDIVLAQKPPTGAEIADGATVTLTVRRVPGPAPGPRFLPSLVGLDIAEARRRLKELDLDAVEREVVDPAPYGRVVDQAPDAGTRIEPGKTVVLSVSSGPGPVRSGLDELRRAMVEDLRIEESGIDADRLTKLFEGAGVTTIDGARALVGLEPPALRDRLTLGSLAAARRFRTILRKALAGLG